MKIKLSKVTVHSFKNFHEMTYKVGSGQLYGRSGEGKSNLLNAIAACFVNSGMDGHKIAPLTNGATSGWVKIDYEIDGESQETYRTWAKTDTGCTSASSLGRTLNKSLFLAIANPMYVFELDNSERIDFVIELNYYDFNNDLASELGDDLPVEVVDFIKEIDKVTLSKLRGFAKAARSEMKSDISNKTLLESQLMILEDVNGVDDLVSDLTAQAVLIDANIQKNQRIIRIIDKINAILLNNSISKINSALAATRFQEDGRLTFCDLSIEQMSSGEKLDCGLELANYVAGRYDFVPPTLIDNITALGHHNIEKNDFPNLSQIITTSFADVDLCEYSNETLYGLDKSWKQKVSTTFRPEVQIELYPMS